MLSYQAILVDEFMMRTAKNGRYSMRGFARDLGISQSFLSQILSKKRKLSHEKALIVSQKLRLRGKKRRLFVDLVVMEQSRRPEVRAMLKSELDQLLKQQPAF